MGNKDRHRSAELSVRTEGVGVVGTSVEATIEAWSAELADQVSLSASAVQDRLLDLWGVVPEGPVRQEVERWLTETLERNLYRSEEVIDRLRRLENLEEVA
jgi:hypothetical protein